jgi:hypothetical protein
MAQTLNIVNMCKYLPPHHMNVYNEYGGNTVVRCILDNKYPYSLQWICTVNMAQNSVNMAQTASQWIHNLAWRVLFRISARSAVGQGREEQQRLQNLKKESHFFLWKKIQCPIACTMLSHWTRTCENLCGRTPSTEILKNQCPIPCTIYKPLYTDFF